MVGKSTVGWRSSLQSEDGDLQRCTKVSGSDGEGRHQLSNTGSTKQESLQAHSSSVLFLMGKARCTKTPNKPPPLLPPTQQPCVLVVTNLTGIG